MYGEPVYIDAQEVIKTLNSYFIFHEDFIPEICSLYTTWRAGFVVSRW